MAQSIPKPKWDTTEFKHHGQSFRLHCFTCGWRSDWLTGHIGQEKADHRFSVHDTRRGPRQMMPDHESKRTYKRRTGQTKRG